MSALRSGVVAILLIGLLTPVDLTAEQLDRLFFSPGERICLEQLRWRAPEPKPAAEQQVEDATDSSSDEKPAFITMSGLMTRSSGAPVLWLNGASYRGKKFPENVRLPKPVTAGQIVLRVPEKGKSYRLRPGQTLDVVSGQVRPTYERGAAAAVANGGESVPGPDAGQPLAAGKEEELPPVCGRKAAPAISAEPEK